jgi:hypothetical protein
MTFNLATQAISVQKTPCIRFLSIFHQFDSLCIALSHCIGIWQKSCRLEINLAS